MKKIILILVIVGVVVWSMGNRDQVDAYAAQAKNWFERTVLKKTPEAPVAAEDESDELPSSKEKSDVASAPPASPAVSQPVEPKKVEESLPEGYYYTKERVSQLTNTGVAAIAKGVKVRKISESNGDYVVSDGTLEIPASPSSLTRDAAEIAVLTAPVLPPKTEVKSTPAVAATATAAAKPAPKSNQPHPDIPRLTSRLDALDLRIKELNRELEKLENERDLAKLRGRVSSAHVYIGRLQGQLDQANAERRTVAASIAELR